MTPTVYKVWRVSRASKEALRVSLTRLPQAGGYRGAGQLQHISAGAPVPGGEDSNKLSHKGPSIACRVSSEHRAMSPARVAPLLVVALQLASVQAQFIPLGWLTGHQFDNDLPDVYCGVPYPAIKPDPTLPPIATTTSATTAKVEPCFEKRWISEEGMDGVEMESEKREFFWGVTAVCLLDPISSLGRLLGSVLLFSSANTPFFDGVVDVESFCLM
ncbi:hypothetical protein O3P69_016361 [Scylla paramamosain]|uniref:Uncharacterized protein n=1 Tax=Scylla paramamosain TaxID=85552 RepID=A0AAW0TDQ7_SCYPA